MKTLNTYYSDKKYFQNFITEHNIVDNKRMLIQIFTSYTDETNIAAMLKEIASLFPQAAIIGSTTAGEICSGRVSTGKHVIALTQFENTELNTVFIDGREEALESFEIGKKLSESIDGEDAKLLITFLDGLNSNGEEYLNGIAALHGDLTIVGGMAGDNGEFRDTFVFNGEHITSHGAVGVVLSNPDLYIHTDYSFNWLPIGKAMTITKVEKNRVYTIDDIPVHDIYEKYLGEEVARELPAIGTAFPLIVEKENGPVSRAMLSTHKDGSLSFAGDLKKGDTVHFGYGDIEMILNGSIETEKNIVGHPIESIFVYSCMARRAFMPNLIESEILPFQELATVTGFFTYGEFFSFHGKYELFNQTMTILGLSESERVEQRSIHRSKNSLNEYQKMTKALSHLLNVTTKEAAEELALLKKNTELIKAQKEALDEIQEIGHFGSWEIDLKKDTAKWSKRSFEIYQLDPKTTQPTLDTFLSRVIEQDKNIVYNGLKNLQDGEKKTATVRVKRGDGEIITILLNAKMLFDDEGEPEKIIGTTLDITEQLRLKQENRELADIIEHYSGEVFILELGTFRCLYVNGMAIRKLGYTDEEICHLSILDINRSITNKQLRDMEKKIRANVTVFDRTIYTKKDGSEYPVQIYAQYGKYHNKDAMIIFNIDITHLVAVEKKEIQQAQILEQIHDAVISCDLDNKIIHWNHGATEMLGYNALKMIGKSIEILYPEDEFKKAQWIKMQTLLYGSYHDHIRKVTKEGKIIYADISASVLRDEKKRVIGVTYYSQDITHKKEIEKKLQEQTNKLNFQAYHDPLPQLPNRTLFNDRLEQTIAHAQRHDKKFGVFFIDLDNFKQINDTLGHHIGDEVLKIVAQRLLDCIRDEDTVSRLGGDEFTLLVHELATPESAAKIAEKMLNAMKEKITFGEHKLYVTSSIGISLYPQDSIHKNDLLKYADSAMYKAKEEGRNNYQFYSTEMTNLAVEKAMMEGEVVVKEKENTKKIDIE